MEPKNANTFYGECRCCLAKGQHRDMLKEYYFNGLREVYFDTFMECFNLFLSTNSLLTTLICTKCIQRLRDANSFRMMVASTERQLLQTIAGANQDTVFVNVFDEIDVKEEVSRVVKLELSDAEIDVVEYDTEFDVSADIPDDNLDSWVDREAEFLKRFDKSKLTRLPTRQTLPELCPDFCRNLDMLQNIKVLPRNIVKLLEDDKLLTNKKVYITEKFAHVVNASTLILHSNVTPFKSKSRSGFPCFYCRNVFENIDILREHTQKHKKSEIKRVLKNYGAECLVVYVDITDLKCTICDKSIESLNALKTHLTNIHKKKMYPDYTDRVIPYKLSPTSVYECQICGFNFETFGSIERHMNVHYRNYVCKQCGTGFVTKYRLRVHIKSMHASGNFPCEVCGKIFTTQQKYKNHVNTVHKLVKRFKCTKCQERFAEYFTRQKHLVQVHGVAPLRYKCNVCDKTFERRYNLSRHLKRDHLEERTNQCELCSYTCFTKHELTVHMVKHTGERIFECAVCKKSYARKKTLKEHMRIHNNDRRFACTVCGQAFVQKCSLKGHLKTHHLEFNIQ